MRRKLLPGSVPSQKLPRKTTTPKQRILSVRQQITVKSTPKRTQKTSQPITSMTKDIETQTQEGIPTMNIQVLFFYKLS